MLVALCAKLVEGLWIGRMLSPLIVYVGGYGPLLSCIKFAAHIKELLVAELRWEKTEKTGRAVMARCAARRCRVGEQTDRTTAASTGRSTGPVRNERRLFFKALIALGIVVVVVVLRALFFA